MAKHRLESAPLLPLWARKWLYGVAVALIPLLVAYGLMSTNEAPLWLALIAAVLGGAPNLVALANAREPEHYVEVEE